MFLHSRRPLIAQEVWEALDPTSVILHSHVLHFAPSSPFSLITDLVYSRCCIHTGLL